MIEENSDGTPDTVIILAAAFVPVLFLCVLLGILVLGGHMESEVPKEWAFALDVGVWAVGAIPLSVGFIVITIRRHRRGENTPFETFIICFGLILVILLIGGLTAWALLRLSL